MAKFSKIEKLLSTKEVAEYLGFTPLKNSQNENASKSK